MDAETKRAIQSLTRELQRTQAELARVKRGGRRPQLGSSSIDSGALEVRDPETGATRLRLGYQPDGSVGVVPEGGDPPPAPTTPQVDPIGSGLSVRWDGQLAGGEALPGDFDHVNVYVSPESGFTPTGGSFAGTIHRDGGALPVAPLEVGVRYYARLVGVGTGGVQGPPSEQSSGVPESVTDIEPGSITETDIADDAITTPKIRAEAVQALHIAAEQIQAGHIEAAAITAAKLEADLVLGTRVIAGNPGGARVEIDENGLRGYDDGNELVFAVQDGDAVFSGTITGSEIVGSRFALDADGGAMGVIEADFAEGAVRSQVISAVQAQAQLAAGLEQAEFSAWGNRTDPASPAGAVIAQPGMAQLVLYSHITLNTAAPFMSFSANSSEAMSRWRSETGAEVRIRATSSVASAQFSPPAAADPDDRQGEGFIFANRSDSDIAAVSLQSPRWEEEGSPAHLRRSAIFAEGANETRPYTRISQAANRVLILGEATGGSYDTTSDGVVDIADTHSIRAPRHDPLETVLDTNPTFNVSGSYVDFTEAQMPSLEFRTGWSGRVRISLMSAGYNNAGNDTNLRLAFRLSGAQSISAAPARGTWMTNSGSGSTSRQMSTRIVTMNLQGNADYTLHPQWYSSTNSGSVTFSVALGNTIIVEPLM